MAENLVVIPTYNEKDNIRSIIKAVFELPEVFHVLVVDDGSPDGTADIVKDLIANQYKGLLYIEEREGKQGLGTAYIHGFRWGLKKGYSFIYEMDADFSHPPQKLVAFYHVLKNKEADVVVGSRYTKGGKVENWPKDRIALSYGASLYVRAITWMPVKDPTAGFVGYSATVLKTLDLSKIRFVGYAFQIEMKFTSRLHGFKIKEVPITFVDRVAGESKLSKKIIKEALYGVWAMRLKSIFNRKSLA